MAIKDVREAQINVGQIYEITGEGGRSQKRGKTAKFVRGGKKTSIHKKVGVFPTLPDALHGSLPCLEQIKAWRLINVVSVGVGAVIHLDERLYDKEPSLLARSGGMVVVCNLLWHTAH